MLYLATCRQPGEKEIKRGLNLIEALKKDGTAADVALRYFRLVVLNLNEFVYLD